MPTRRTAMILIGAATLPWPVRDARAQAGEHAVAFIKSTTDKLVAIVNSPPSPQEKRQRLREVIDAAVDLQDIGRYCLGRFWRIATPDQQKQYMAVFHDLLVAQIAGHLGEYQGVRITMGLSRTFRDTEIVITTVDRPGAPSARVDWVVGIGTGAPKIVDLVAEGTSMRITQASDFTAFLASHQYNIQDLIDGMRQKSAQNG
jgi:phospholipid transport system substrate-binding protein